MTIAYQSDSKTMATQRLVISLDNGSTLTDERTNGRTNARPPRPRITPLVPSAADHVDNRELSSDLAFGDFLRDVNVTRAMIQINDFRWPMRNDWELEYDAQSDHLLAQIRLARSVGVSAGFVPEEQNNA